MVETSRSVCTFTLTEVLQAVRRDFVPCPHFKCRSSVQSFMKKVYNNIQEDFTKETCQRKGFTWEELVENNPFQFGKGKIDWRIYKEERPGKL